MNFFIFLVLIGFTTCESQVQDPPGQCTTEEQGTLDWRVQNSEVVITGTVKKIDSESSHAYEEHDEFDVKHSEKNLQSNKIGHQTVGFVQLWTVVKGSIDHVTNYTRDTEERDGINSPVLKLYGLWNNHVCGSFLNVGDTRIFFLRKLLDARPDISKRINETESLEAQASAYLGQLTSSIPTAEDALSLAPPVEKHRKRRRGKKRGRKRSQNGEKRKKSKRGRKRRARRKRKTTESMMQTLSNFQSPLIQRQNRPRRRIRMDADEGRQVLVVVSSPARITLDNLNMIEGIVEVE